MNSIFFCIFAASFSDDVIGVFERRQDLLGEYSYNVFVMAYNL